TSIFSRIIWGVFAGERRTFPRYVSISASNSAGVDPSSGYWPTAFPASSINATLSDDDDFDVPGLRKGAGVTGGFFLRRTKISTPAISPAMTTTIDAVTGDMG